MFYCDDCAKKYGYPIRLRKDYGPCELCRKTGPCNDVPSSELPEPKKEAGSKSTRMADGIIIICSGCHTLNVILNPEPELKEPIGCWGCDAPISIQTSVRNAAATVRDIAEDNEMGLVIQRTIDENDLNRGR